MKILHYSLGLPPYRTGGLTKYSVDLMKEEIYKGHEVFLLYPGKINLLRHNTKIIKNNDFNKIKVFELINPLPVPLSYGIKDIKKYIRKIDINIFKIFFNEINIDCIHIHTFMGLPKEFLIAANKLKIKIVFTSHDYFGLCPKSTLYNLNYQNCNGYDNKDCSLCCLNALSYKKIIILQSHLYKIIKETKFIKRIRNNEKNKICSKTKKKLKIKIEDYEILKKYYYSMFEYIDIFHFNSINTYKVYNNHIKINNYKIMPIIHSNIKDNRRKYNIKNENDIITIGYLGTQTIDKGFFSLIKVLDKIKNRNIRLSIYFKTNIKREYLNIHERYDYNEIENIFTYNDIIIMPSLSRDTFGFVVLEALSYGKPVIVSQNVGAKEIIKNSITGYIYENEKELLYILKNLNKKEIAKLNNNILKEDVTIFDMNKHVDKIIELYNE